MKRLWKWVNIFPSNFLFYQGATQGLWSLMQLMEWNLVNHFLSLYRLIMAPFPLIPKAKASYSCNSHCSIKSIWFYFMFTISQASHSLVICNNIFRFYIFQNINKCSTNYWTTPPCNKAVVLVSGSFVLISFVIYVL